MHRSFRDVGLQSVYKFHPEDGGSMTLRKRWYPTATWHWITTRTATAWNYFLLLLAAYLFAYTWWTCNAVITFHNTDPSVSRATEFRRRDYVRCRL